MKNYNEYSEKVGKCLTDINADLAKIVTQGKSKKYFETMFSIVIHDNCHKYNLSVRNINAIFNEKFKR